MFQRVRPPFRWWPLVTLVVLTLVNASPAPSTRLNKAAPASAHGAAALDVPAGFLVENAASGAVFNLPTAVAFAPDGRIFVTEKRGHVYIIKNGVKLSTPFINLETEVLDHHDRGLLGIALDPNFASNRFVYLLYPVERDGTGDYDRRDAFGRLVRYTASSVNPDVADLSSRKVLIGNTFADGIPACAPSHATGDIQFGTDGTMLISTGDAALSRAVDAGGLYPECFGTDRINPREDVGAFRAQYLESLAGKILRIDPATGLGVPSNPFYDASNPGSSRSRVWAYGLRNPFRFAVRSNGSTNIGNGRPGSLYVGDVGWNTWEDLNTAAPAGKNFGWPCYEGPNMQPQYQAATPAHSGCSTTGTVTAPKMYWHHGKDWKSRPAGLLGKAIVAGAFYVGTKYPADYQGRFFYADYVLGWMASAKVDNNDNLTEQQIFSTNIGAIVDIEYDPVSQFLYYVNISSGEVLRIRYTSGSQNEPPVARASATPTSGPVPLAVQFTGSQSTDPNGDALAYRWDFGNGATSTQADPSYTYTAAGTYSAALTVTDPSGAAASHFLTITAGNSPPDGTILSPADGAVVAVGDVVILDATATDPNESAANLQYRWEVTLIHNEHEHPGYYTSANKSTSFVVTEHDGSAQYAYKVQLLVTDSGGLTDVTTHRISVGSSGNQLVNGLYAEYYDNQDFTGPLRTRIDPKVNFVWKYSAPISGMGSDQFSVRWTGWVKPAYSQTYTFYTVTNDGARLWVNGQLLIDRWVVAPDGTQISGKKQITLQAEQLYEIKMEYFDATGKAQANLYWSSPSQAKVIIPQSRLFTSAPTTPLVSSSAAALAEPAVTAGRDGVPGAFALDQNYPNPFNPETTIRFALPEAARVTLEVYDLLGRRVATLQRDEMLEAGWHSVPFEATALASGTYIYRIAAGSYTATKVMVLQK